MSQDVQVPGVGTLQFPDGMSQQDMATAIQKNFPQIHPQSGPSHDAGLGARAAIEGAGDLVMLPQHLLDALDVGAIATRNHIRALFGLPPDVNAQSSSGTNPGTMAADALGLDKPVSGGEKLASAAVRGAAGGALVPAAGAAGVIRALASGASGGTSSEAVRQAGGGTLAQIAAGAVGGMGPALAETAARGGARIVAGAARPLTAGGQQDMAAQIFQDAASDPQTAAASLERARSIVPGSARTSGEASQDVGLLTLEKGVRGKNTAAFGQRLSEQNAARQAALTQVGGKPTDIAAAEEARNAETSGLREQALKTDTQADMTGVHYTIDSILKSPQGKREVVSSAMNWAKGLIGGETDPAALYEIRKDLQLAQRGKLQPTSANAPNASTLAQARGQLGSVVNALDDSIEQAAPGFKAYLQRYSELSRPIDQMKVIQEIQKRAQLTSADVTTGENFLGNGAFSKALDAAMGKNGSKLTPTQIAQLKAVRTDLQMGQAINSPLVKAPGSDTFQNLSIAQVIGAGPNPANAILKGLSKPLQWLYKSAGSDDKVNEILANAMLDPKMASALLKRATPSTVGQLAGQLRQIVSTSARGTAGGIASNSGP